MSNDVLYARLFAEARQCGLDAGNKSSPRPMVVSEGNFDGTPKAGGQSWYVSEGVCGFAWVKVRPGNCSFAKWLVKSKNGRKSYSGGVDIWISDFNQSMERKAACAEVMAKFFRDNLGLVAYADSRMD